MGSSFQRAFNDCQILKHFNVVNLRSSFDICDVSESSDKSILEYIVPQTYVAVAANKSSIDTAWFIKVIENDLMSNGDDTDDYGHTIIKDSKYNMGHFLERFTNTRKGELYKLSNKRTFFYSESVIYPFVDVKEEKKGLFISNNELTNIIRHIEENNFSHI